METNEILETSLKAAAQKERGDFVAKQAENKKLYASEDFWAFSALRRMEGKKINAEYGNQPRIVDARASLEKAQAALLEAKKVHAPAAYAAEVELKEISKALRAFILTGEATKVGDVEIRSIGDCIRAYNGIRAQMVAVVEN